MAEPAPNVVSFRMQAERITRENLLGRKTTNSIHFNRGRKFGGAWSFGVEGIPRLTAWRDRSGTKWAIDGKTIRDLDTALAVLNGERTLEDAVKEAEQIIPPEAYRPGKVSIQAQLDEIDYELAQRKTVYARIAASNPSKAGENDLHVARMQAVRATLVWLRDNEASIKQRASY